MRKTVKISLIIFIVAFMLVLVIYPERYVQKCFEGIRLWAFSVVPSLLPFFFLTQLLTMTGNLSCLSKKFNKASQLLYRTDGISFYVQTMSILSGYPIGAKLISELFNSKTITADEATRMSTFCSTSGPLFIIGTIGNTFFGNKFIGFAIFISHVLTSIICGIIFRKYGKNRPISRLNTKNNNIDNALYEAIYQSVIALFIVGGFIAVFYTLSQALTDFKILYPIEKLLSFIISGYENGFLCGLIECTTGCKILSKINTRLSISLCCGLISFGGISVICQSVVFLQKANANTKIFILSKLIQMFVSITICYLILLLPIFSFN